MTKTPGTYLLLSKADDWSRHAAELAEVMLGRVVWIHGSRTDPFPASAISHEWSGVLSFVSPWIVPRALLSRARVALNFHPGPVEYPGIGCYNFALYEGATTYGAVC